MKKFACILGIILSIALVALGVCTLSDGVMTLSGDVVDYEGLSIDSYFSGLTLTSTSFGADFYTYSYKATRAAANNVEALGEYLEKALNTVNYDINRVGNMLETTNATLLGYGLIVSGLFSLLLSLYGLGAASTAQRQIELLEQIRIACRSDDRQLDLLRQIANKQFTANVTLPAAPAVPAPAPATPARPAVTAPVTPVRPAVTAPAAPARPAAPVRQKINGDRWICAKCAHSNPARLSSCDICGERRDAEPTPAVPAQPAAEAAPAVPVQPAAEATPAVPVQPAAEAAPAVPAQPVAEEVPAVPAQPAGNWNCPVCAMDNMAGDEVCICCGEKRPTA